MRELKTTLDLSKSELHGHVSSSLKDYFDPTSGRFHERVERLIKQDGDLEQVLRRQIGGDGSELAKTFATHIGESSPLMRLLNPKESDGLVSSIRSTISEVSGQEKERILREFSLDNEGGALKRLVTELTVANGRLKTDLASEVSSVVKEFSLDDETSALSRLVRRVELAQQTISNEFSLDDKESALSRLSSVISEAKGAIDANLTLDAEGSALSRLKRELLEVLKVHQDKAAGFQSDVMSALDSMQARRAESARSTQHGHAFEQVLCEVISAEVQKASDVPTRTGATTGLIKNCKKGDLLIELGADCAAAGARVVVEAKEDASYTVQRALVEIEEARKNRGASIGLFVFSAKTAPAGIPAFARHGHDIILVWDAEKAHSDVVLQAGLSVAKALCVRHKKECDAADQDWSHVDAAILAVEKEAARLNQMKTWTETIKSSSEKVLDEIRKMNTNLTKEVVALRESVDALKTV